MCERTFIVLKVMNNALQVKEKQKYMSDNGKLKSRKEFRTKLSAYTKAKKEWVKFLNVGFGAGYCLGLCRVQVKKIYAGFSQKKTPLEQRYYDARHALFDAKNNKEMKEAGFDCQMM